MSYNLVDPTTGDLTRVAGLGRAEYGASAVRSGTYTPGSSVQPQEDLSFSVTFDTPMPDSDYQVIFGSSSNDASSGIVQCAIRSRTPTGFTGVVRNVGKDPISVASGTFTWFAFKLYSDVEYSNIVNSMPADASATNKLVTMGELIPTIEYISGSLLSSVVTDSNLYYQKFGNYRIVINGWIKLGAVDAVSAVSAGTKLFTLPNNWKAFSNYLISCYVDNSNAACACMIYIGKGDVIAYTPIPTATELRFCGEIYLK